MSDTPKPTDIVVHQKAHTLEIAFDDGARFDLPFELLRVYSPSAEVRGHWGQHAKLQVDKQDVGITDVKPIGAYAVKLFFDDGHDSGLYDWGYLYDLGRKQSLYWNAYLQKLAEAGHQRTPPSWQ
ncbi:MAG: DUF971 domain-containing protein [Gammaproteobacteria bacterium]|nr:DUF971 domain-containing protein [Gammaproteobacteria bacterium]MCB1924020.1 DUF971 domain-containing protein [Gammaproteobacteria bacterium]